MGLAFMPQLRENLEHLAFQGMVRAGHANLAREVAEVGSLS
jgi:hypothetical protein